MAKKKESAEAAEKPESAPQEKSQEKVQRYVSAKRIDERKAQGWTIVSGAHPLRNGSVLMEK